MNGLKRGSGSSVALAICAGLALTTGGAAQWVEEATLGNLVEQSRAGAAVALDGSLAVIGAPLDEENGDNAGAAYVYRFDGTDWLFEQKLLAEDGAPRQQFGRAVALSADLIMIGAPRPGLGVAGTAYVFRYDDGIGAWEQEARLDGQPLTDLDGFGASVAIDADRAIVGAPMKGNESSRYGAIYFFERQEGGWIQIGHAAGENLDAHRGFAVAMNGDMAIDTAPGYGGGHATVWRHDGEGWRPVVELDPGAIPDYRRFGISVATDGARIIIGSDRQPLGPGMAFVFAHDGGSWFEEGVLASPPPVPEAPGEVFGCSVDIQGEVATVGSAPLGGESEGAGSTYVYRLFSGIAWDHEWTIHNSSAGSGDRFGADVAMGGTCVLIGCPRIDGETGAAFMYRCAYVLGEAPSDTAGVSVIAIDDVNFDGFEDFVVGAPRADARGPDGGCIDVYSGRTRELLYHRFGQAGERLGWALGSVGDVDGDGAGDFAVGSPGWNDRRGRVTVYSGRLGKVLHRAKGEYAGDRFGMALSCELDVNADGKADLVVGAPYNDDAGKRAGKVYLMRARNGNSLGAITGRKKGDLFGFAIAALGQVNIDPYDDFAVGAPKSDKGGNNAGRVTVFSGKTLRPRYAVDGMAPGDRFGWSIGCVGRVTGDSRIDFVVGAPFADRGDRASTGRISLHSGRSGERLWGRNGARAGDRLGWAVAALTDFNGDRHPDVLASAPRSDFMGTNAGRVAVRSGIDGYPLRLFLGEAPGDRCGYAVAAIGDLDGDGLDEALIAAPYNDAFRTRGGKVHIMMSAAVAPPLGPFTGEETWDPAGPAPLTWEGADEDQQALARLLAAWGRLEVGEEDLDADGDVDEADLRELLSEWDR